MNEVSIVLPVWNGEEFLSLAIESILNQTFTDFELIIVDDCSTDLTPKIIDKYLKIDNRIKLIRNEVNKKLPESLNIGFSIARGNFYTWTSDDNVLHKNFLEILYNNIKISCFDIVYSDFNLINKNGRLISKRILGDANQLLYRNSIGASFIYNSKVHNFLGGYQKDKFMYEDYDFWFRAYCFGFKFNKINEIIYDYREHENSLSYKIEMPTSHILNLYNNRMLDIREFYAVRHDAFINLINYPKQLGIYRWLVVLFQMFKIKPGYTFVFILKKIQKFLSKLNTNGNRPIEPKG